MRLTKRETSILIAADYVWFLHVECGGLCEVWMWRIMCGLDVADYVRWQLVPIESFLPEL